MELITSRKNKLIVHLRALGTRSAYRRDCGEYIVDGHKMLSEALENAAQVNAVLWREGPMFEISGDIEQYCAPDDLFEYASPLKDSPGPVFSLKIPKRAENLSGSRVIILENVQDPGNVGTVIRTANALGFDDVVLTGACADIYNPKTVRATMGAIFRQNVVSVPLSELKARLQERGLALYAAALTDTAVDIRQLQIEKCAVAIGSEGSGLTQELLSICDGQLIIPMQAGSESLNAAVAATIVMWESVRIK